MLSKRDKIFLIVEQIWGILIFVFYAIGIERLRYDYNWVVTLILITIIFDIYCFKKVVK